MNDDTQKIEVNIMGKLYPVLCSPQQQEELAEAVSFLNSKIEEIKHGMNSMRSSDAVWNRDSLLAIIALNLSYELLKMNTAVSSKALDAERLIERIKSSFVQPDADDDRQKISEISL